MGCLLYRHHWRGSGRNLAYVGFDSGFGSGRGGSRSPRSPMGDGLPARKASNTSILSRFEDKEEDDQISLPG